MSINPCRLCKSSCNSFTRIFENDSKMAMEIFLITGIKIVELKCQAALMCHQCQASLSAAIKFRNLCQSTEETFRKHAHANEAEIFSKELEILEKRIIKREEGEEVHVKCEQIFAEYPGTFENVKSKDDERAFEALRHQKHTQKFFCDQCEKEYVHKNALKNHIFRCHAESPPRLSLSHRSFKSKSLKIKPREKLTHQVEYICPICAKIFKTRSNLSQHEKTHKVLLPSQYYYCDLCGNKFREKSLMCAHIKNRHIKKIRFQCQLCDKNYATKFHLSTHMKVIHMGYRDFKCHYCEKEFGEKKKLVAHERVHTGEQPFSCRYCDRKFTHQTDFRRHQWNHENHKRFICQNQNCNQGFMKRAELQSHMNRCRINS